MIIKRLKISDFLIFKDVDLDLSRVTVISVLGKWENDLRRSNGAGKSALLEAISFALFGITRSKLKEDIVRKGQKRALVDLTIQVGDNEIRVVRSKGSTNSAVLYINKKKSASGSKNVDAMLRTYLGIDQKIFDLIYFFKQNNHFQFLNSTPSERKTYLTKIFDFEQSERCLEVAKSKSNEIGDRILQIEGEMAFLEDEIDSSYDSYYFQEKIVDNEQLECSFLIKQEALLNIKEELRQAYQELLQLGPQFESFYSSIVGAIERLQLDLEENNTRQNEIKRELSFLENSLSKLSQKITDSTREYNSIVLGGNYKDVDNKIIEARNNIDEINEKMAQVDSQKKQLEVFLKNVLSKQNSRCVECGQIISKQHAHAMAQQYEPLIRDLSRRYDEFLEKKKTWQKVFDDLLGYRERRQKKNSVFQILNSRKEEYVRLKDDVDKKNKVLESLHEKFVEIQTQLEKKRAEKDNIDVVAVWNQFQKRKVLYENMLSTIEKQLVDISGSISSAISERKRFVEKINERKRLESKLTKLKSELNQLKVDQVVFGKLINIFGKNGLQAIIIDNIVGLIEQFANEILTRMSTRFKVSLDTLKQKQDGELKETLDINVYDNNVKRALETYSGGERTLINLSLRLALSRVISSIHDVQVDCVFLDEILASLDDVNREEALKIIKFLSKSFVQVFIISHTDNIKAFIPDSLLVKRFEDFSEVEVKNG